MATEVVSQWISSIRLAVDDLEDEASRVILLVKRSRMRTV